MLKAHDISFLRLLTVGYISSETYHAVKNIPQLGVMIQNLLVMNRKEALALWAKI